MERKESGERKGGSGEAPSPTASPSLESIGSLALQWVAADTKAKALRKERAEIISRLGGCSRNNQRGPDGYTLGPCYLETIPDFEGCACCRESQPAHLAYHAAVAKASALRRAIKRAARIVANEVSAAKPQQTTSNTKVTQERQGS